MSLVKELIPKEVVHKAIRCELPFEEIEKMAECLNFEPDDYFDLDAYVSAIHKFMEGEMERGDHINWALVCMKSLYDNNIEKSALRKIYTDTAWGFDGYAFLGYNKGEKLSFCREMIADLKYANHKIQNKKNNKKARFYNDNKTVVHIAFSHCNSEVNEYYNICVVDHKNKRFKVGYVVNPDFLEKINYTFHPYGKFDNFAMRYCNYYQDESIDFSRYIGRIK